MFKWTQRTLITIALLIMLAHFGIYVVYAAELITFPFDYDQGEGFELTDALYLSDGKLPYQNAETFPYYSSNYPPVYRAILAPFAAIFGAEYWYGRLVSFLSTLITALLIGFVVYREERRDDIAILMALAFLASNYIYHIGPLFRQHYFMVMFEALAVVSIATLFEDDEKTSVIAWRPAPQKRLLIGLFFLLLAGYTKQLAAVTVLAVFIWLFIRQPRWAIFYGLGFGMVTGAVFVALNLATGGGWWDNVVGANVNQYIPSQFTGLFRQFLRLHWVLLLFAGLMVLYELYFDRLSLYAVWLGVALVSTVGSGTWGAGDSYYATSIVAACMMSGRFISRTLNQNWTFEDNYIMRLLAPILKPIVPYRTLLTQGIGLISLGLMIVYGLTVVKLPTSGVFEPIAEALNVSPNPGHRYPLYDAAGWTAGYATIGHLPSQADIDAGWEIVDRIQAVDKPVMSEEAGFSLQADREVISNPTQLQNLYDNDLLDPSNLINDVENHVFGLIIFRAQFYPKPVLAAVHDAYHPTEVIAMNGFNYELWYPEPTWQTRRAIRNYLEAPNDEPFSIPLSENVTDVNQWLVDMMARWAWLPEVDAEPQIAPDCLTRSFLRRGERAEIQVCDEEITVSITTLAIAD